MRNKDIVELLSRHCENIIHGNLENIINDYENSEKVNIEFNKEKIQGKETIQLFYERIISSYKDRDIRFTDFKIEILSDMSILQAICLFKGTDEFSKIFRISFKAEITCSVDEEENKCYLHSVKLV